jgi:hypothetical protein
MYLPETQSEHFLLSLNILFAAQAMHELPSIARMNPDKHVSTTWAEVHVAAFWSHGFDTQYPAGSKNLFEEHATQDCPAE